MSEKHIVLLNTSEEAKDDQNELIRLIEENDRHFGKEIIQRMESFDLEQILRLDLLFVKMNEIWNMKDSLEKDARNELMYGLVGEFLDRIGFETNEYVGPDRNDLLHGAIFCKNIPLVNRFINAGVRLDGENVHGHTALEASAVINDFDLFKRFCYRGFGIHRYIDPYIKTNKHIEVIKSRPKYEDQIFHCHNQLFEVFRDEFRFRLKNASSKQLASIIGTYPVIAKENSDKHFSVTLQDNEVHLQGCSFRYALVLLPIKLHEETNSFKVAKCAVPLKKLPSIHKTRKPDGERIPDMGHGESRRQNYLGVKPGWLFICRPEKKSLFKFQVEDHKEDFDFVAIALLRYTVNGEMEKFCKQGGAIHYEPYIHLNHPYCTTPGRHGTYMNLTKPETCKYQEHEERRLAAEREQRKNQQMMELENTCQRHVDGSNSPYPQSNDDDDELYGTPQYDQCAQYERQPDDMNLNMNHGFEVKQEIDDQENERHQHQEERRYHADRSRERPSGDECNQREVKEEPEDDYEVPTRQTPVELHDHMESGHNPNHQRRHDRPQDVSPSWNRTHEYRRNRWTDDHQEGPSTGRPRKRPYVDERRGNQREVKEVPDDDYEVPTRQTPVQRNRQMENRHSSDQQHYNRRRDVSPPRNRTREYRDRFANDHQEGPSTGPVRSLDGNRYHDHYDERYQEGQHRRNYDRQYRRRDDRYNKPEHKRRY